MDIKFNEATHNRPEGDRIVTAPFVFIDIENGHRQLLEEEAWQKNDRNGITLFKAENQTIVLTALHAGAEVPANEIKGHVNLHLLQGSLSFYLGGEEFDMKEGNIVALLPHLKHGFTAKDDSLVLITTNLL